MKTMKKGLPALLLALLCVLSLSACAAGKVEYEGAAGYAEDVVLNLVQSAHEVENQFDLQLENYQDNTLMYDTLMNYKETVEKYGTLNSVETESVSETETGIYMVKLDCTFGDVKIVAGMEVGVEISGENRITGVVSYSVVSAEPMTFDRELTVGEKLENAGLNTLMGMGVVFCVLILICFIIYLFSFINKLENRTKKGERNIETVKQEQKAAPAPAVEIVQDDTELIAVIAAAIAAAEGTSPDGIIVRSIRKVNQANNWKRG